MTSPGTQSPGAPPPDTPSPGAPSPAGPPTPAPSRRREAWQALAVAALGAALFFLPLLAVTDRDPLAPLDRDLSFVARDLSETAVRVVEVVTALGALPTAAAAVIAASILLATAGRRRAALALAGGFIAIVIAVHFLKAGVGRLRPPGADPSLTTASFPSGHSAYSTAFTAIAVAFVWRAAPNRAQRRVLLACACLLTVTIGVTRILLGVHYLSDVVAGWGLGAAIFGVSAAAACLVGSMRHTGSLADPPPAPGGGSPTPGPPQ